VTRRERKKSNPSKTLLKTTIAKSPASTSVGAAPMTNEKKKKKEADKTKTKTNKKIENNNIYSWNEVCASARARSAHK